MNKTEITLLATLGIVLAVVVLFNLKGGLPDPADETVGASQNPDSANTNGPEYLVARMPYGYGPPVTMQAPMTSQGFLGQVTPTGA